MAWSVVEDYCDDVSRWPPDARPRLEQAAVELFIEQGFAATTVPQITSRAGLTTRTYFRHFADKREVLFGVEAELAKVVRASLADAPPTAGPMELVGHGLGRVAAVRFDGLFGFLQARRAIIRSDESLRERELAKLAALGAAIVSVLEERGLTSDEARLAAGAAVTVFDVALDRWLDQDGPEPPLSESLRETVESYRAVTGVVVPLPAPAQANVEREPGSDGLSGSPRRGGLRAPKRGYR